MNDYKCADCGCPINKGEFDTFGVCDDCWDENYKQRILEQEKDRLAKIQYTNGGQIPAYGNEKTSAQVISELKEENKLLKQSLERLLHIIEHGWEDNEQQAIIEAQQLLKL